MPMYDFHKPFVKHTVDRICFVCDHHYKGLIYCPKCSEPSGEPLREEEEPQPADST
jgi:hypothetical protein